MNDRKRNILLISPFLGAAIPHVATHIIPKVRLNKSPEEVVKALYKAFGRKDVPTFLHERGSFYVPIQHLLSVGNPNALFHETAHSISPLLKDKAVVRILEHMNSVADLSFLAPLADYLLRKKEKKPYLTYATVLASIPQVIEETRANIIGSRLASLAAKNKLISSAVKPYIFNAASEFGYLAPPLLALLAVKKLIKPSRKTK